MPQLILEGKADELVSKFEEAYLEVKARKEVYLAEEAESYFHYLQPKAREAAVLAASRGLSQAGWAKVLVLEHLDGDVVERSLAMKEGLEEMYGKGSFYMSLDKWECQRDIEFFFPHLDALPVERTLAVIKPDAVQQGEKGGKTAEQVVEDEAAQLGLFVVSKQLHSPDEAQAKLICQEYDGTADHTNAVAAVMAEPGCLVMCIEGRGAIGKMQLRSCNSASFSLCNIVIAVYNASGRGGLKLWNPCFLLQRLICGPSHSGVARERAPTTIRALWGTDGTSNAMYASLNMEAADKEIKAFFPDGALKLERTLCIVKPDAIANLVAIKTEIEAAGFTVLKEKQTTLSEERAKEFYRSSKSDPSFAAVVKESCSGPCCAMVLCRVEAVTVLKQLMGNASVKEAKKSRPGSLRARFGRDGQRNAVHGSESLKDAVQEIRFFFPEMGVDPLPDDNEVRDFIFRKSARASMDLQTLSDAQATDFELDPTMQQLISNGLIGLCKVKPQGLAAVKWLANWLSENNPNNQAPKAAFDPPTRTSQYVESGVNQDGMAFVVEAPAPEPPSKPIVEVTEEDLKKEPGESDLKTPPFVVFVAGGPGCGKGTQCTRIKDEFNLIHLSTGDLMRAEVKAGSFLGGEIEKHMSAGTLVPDDIVLQLLKKAMVKNQDTNRFLLDGFPRAVEQAQRFEREIAEVSFMLYLEASHETMMGRIKGRAATNPGRVDDNDETVRKRLEVFDQQTLPLCSYYGPIGKLRKANAEKAPDEVFAEVKRYFSCRFLYLLGPPGAPVEHMADKLEKQYGYSAINLTTLLKSYADSNEADAPAVRKAMLAGKPVDASIACPLILSEIYRDMALGVQNFVLSDFPQSLKQAQFLEYRVSSITRTLVLDFSRADAADLAATMSSKDTLELELRSNYFFGPEASEMLTALKAERIPYSLSEMQTCSVVDGTWKKLSEQVLPSLTVVLGLPGSGTDVLANLLAQSSPNFEAVDCNELLDKELERQTEMGLAMHNMLAKGQVVPLSMTLELLKGVANLTCSECLIIQNCPQYVDQIELIERDFRINKVYYIQGNEAAEKSWADSFATKEDSATAAKRFSELQSRLPPIVAHFSRLGLLEKFEVSETPSPEKLQSLIAKSRMPQFAVVSSLSPVLGAKKAQELCDAYGGSPITSKSLAEFAGKADDASSSDEVTMLKAFAQGRAEPFLVLQDCPSVDSQAHAFLEAFGAPRAVIYLECDDEFLDEEYRGLHEDEEIDGEQLAEKMAQQRATMEGTMKVFKELCPGSYLEIDKKMRESPTDVAAVIQQKLMPTVYVILSPGTESDFGNLVAETICTMSTAGGLEDALPSKYTILDAMAICKSSGHSPAVEDAIAKASFTAETPDSLPVKVWAEIWREAFLKSADPMGTFLLTNFPTTSSVKSNSVRDQLSVVESVSSLAGILHVKLGAAAFASFCSTDDEKLEAYSAFDAQVHDQTLAQFGPGRIMECLLNEATDSTTAAQKVAAQFFSSQAKGNA
ncbi:AK1 [Symbiodinium sp. CCMP2592]|nr:AK1 [Symbiodinium sp. CCMP2592]